MPDYGEATFGRSAVPIGSTGDVRRPVPNDAVPVRGLRNSPDSGNPDAVSPSWVPRGTRKDHGLCVRCARSGGKGRKKAGSDLCTPHIIQDRRIAAKSE